MNHETDVTFQGKNLDTVKVQGLGVPAGGPGGGHGAGGASSELFAGKSKANVPGLHLSLP